jgi:hypothetical protein
MFKRRGVWLLGSIVAIIVSIISTPAVAAPSSRSSAVPSSRSSAVPSFKSPFLTEKEADKLVPDGNAYSCTPATADPVTTDDQGARFHYYDDINGLRTYTVVPPLGFDPLTASGADLFRYGFPPRPEAESLPDLPPSSAAADLAARMATWDKMAQALETRPSGGLCVTNQFAINVLGYSWSLNWSGTTAYDSSVQPYTDAIGSFYETGFDTSYCDDVYEGEASWIGLGGDEGHGGASNAPLAQAGVFTPANVGDTSPPTYAFFSALNSNDQGAAVSLGFNVNPGDHVLAYVAYRSPYTGFYVWDATTNVANSAVVQFTPGQSTAESIDESPYFTIAGEGFHAELERWASGGVYWDTSGATNYNTGYGGPTDDQEWFNYYMAWAGFDSLSQVTAAPVNGFNTSGGYTDYWYNCTQPEVGGPPG